MERHPVVAEAYRLEEEGRRVQAIDLLRAALVRDPRDVDLHIALAIEVGPHSRVEAIDLVARAAELAGDDPHDLTRCAWLLS
jgi:hypothetical protein